MLFQGSVQLPNLFSSLLCAFLSLGNLSPVYCECKNFLPHIWSLSDSSWQLWLLQLLTSAVIFFCVYTCFFKEYIPGAISHVNDFHKSQTIISNIQFTSVHIYNFRLACCLIPPDQLWGVYSGQHWQKGFLQDLFPGDTRGGRIAWEEKQLQQVQLISIVVPWEAFSVMLKRSHFL